MGDEPYWTLAGVYEWLMPDALLTPQGSAAAFAEVVDRLDPAARVLDCACGPGQLAVGLALQGFEVEASDASSTMVEQARGLAAEYSVALPVVVCRWDQLGQQGWRGRFDVVLCVGNSLTHAAGRAARRSALQQMAAVLRPGGLLVVTSRNWERVRATGSRLTVGDRLVERRGRQALVVHGWTIARGWDDPHYLDVMVAFIEPGGGVTSRREQLTFWPFRHEDLDDDLREAGLTQLSSTYGDDVDRYRVTARADVNVT